MESFIYKSKYKIAIIVIIVLAVVYAISVYTKKHEAKDLAIPSPKESPLKEGGGLDR
jgi:LPS O-antigen subunit length determinant protein (WzzB/FepE family)